jgi:hypothetical protein
MYLRYLLLDLKSVTFVTANVDACFVEARARKENPSAPLQFWTDDLIHAPLIEGGTVQFEAGVRFECQLQLRKMVYCDRR